MADDKFGRRTARTGSVCAASLESAEESKAAMPQGALRALDLLGLLFLFPVVLPVGLLLALFIKLVSPGPVFFRQERVGLGGSRFTLFKFRTMRVDAEQAAHEKYARQFMRSDAPMTKLDHQDTRLIPLGRVLRASGVDELPQLLNVLRGEMRLVGPRPCLPYEYEAYEPWQKRRFEAVPGLTGLWQVSGKNQTTFNEMIELDIQYAETASVWLDLQILAKTLPAVLAQVQALRRRSQDRTDFYPSTAAIRTNEGLAE